VVVLVLTWPPHPRRRRAGRAWPMRWCPGSRTGLRWRGAHRSWVLGRGGPGSRRGRPPPEGGSPGEPAVHGGVPGGPVDPGGVEHLRQREGFGNPDPHLGAARRGGLDQPQPRALTEGEELGFRGVAGTWSTLQRPGRLGREVGLLDPGGCPVSRVVRGGRPRPARRRPRGRSRPAHRARHHGHTPHTLAPSRVCGSEYRPDSKVTRRPRAPPWSPGIAADCGRGRYLDCGVRVPATPVSGRCGRVGRHCGAGGTRQATGSDVLPEPSTAVTFASP